MKKELVKIDKLKDFANFILENCIDKLVQKDLEGAKKAALPLLHIFSHLSEKEIFEFSKIETIKIISSFKAGKAVENAIENVENWKKNLIPNIPRNEIISSDIALINHIKQQSLISLIPSYTSDVNEIIALVHEIEAYYTFRESLAYRTFNEIQQEELKKREATFRSLAEAAFEGIVIIEEGLIIEANTVFQKLVHFNRGELIGKPFWDFAFDPAKEINNKKENKWLETVFIQKNGTKIPVEINARPIYYLGKNLQVKSVRDISTRKKVEQELKAAQQKLVKANKELEARVQERTKALKKSQQQLSLIINAVPALIAYIDKDYQFKYVNKTFNEWHKQNEYSVIGDTMPMVLGKSIFDKIKPYFNQAIKGTSVFYKEKILFRDGQVRDISGIYIPDIVDNEVKGIIVLASNITEIVQAQREVEESTGKFRQLMETIPTIAWTTLPNGTINYINKRWEEFAQTSLSDSSNWDKHISVHPEDLAHTMQVWKNALATGKLYEIEHRWIRHDGAIRWMLSRATPIKNKKKEITLWIGITTDINEQKSTNQQLEKANNALRRINLDLDNFIYTASHDLKAPVSNIEGLVYTFAEILTERKITDNEIENILSLIYSSISRFQKTIKELSDISKIQKVEIERVTEVNIDKLFKELLMDLQPMIESSKAIIHKDFSQLPSFRFSSPYFRSILYNLLTNAIKYRSPNRTLEIFIKTHKVDDFIKIEFSDNGLGFNPKQKEKIFTMFKRFHDHVEGSGIGLYIIKRIIENSGGKIEVESAEGQGTTFTIFLPY